MSAIKNEVFYALYDRCDYKLITGLYDNIDDINKDLENGQIEIPDAKNIFLCKIEKLNGYQVINTTRIEKI